MKTIRRVDENQKQIIGELRQLGAKVRSTHMVGHGFPDLAVEFRGLCFLLEIKNPKEHWSLTPAEELFKLEWEDCGFPIVAETTESAIDQMEAWIENVKSAFGKAEK